MALHAVSARWQAHLGAEEDHARLQASLNGSEPGHVGMRAEEHYLRTHRSDALRIALLMLLALFHDGGTEPAAKVVGQLVQL
jgi:hypothetical protein